MKQTAIQKPLKLAFIGGSVQSAVGYTHFIASQMDHRWQVVAGCFSQRADVNASTAALWGVVPERVYKTWSELLMTERDQIDAVVILTPTPSHAEIVCEAFRQGVAVICEKALATSLAEIAQIREAQAKHNGFLIVTYNYSGYPMLRELRKRIREGELGDVLHIQIEMPQETYVRLDAAGHKPSPQAWRLQDYTVPTIYLDLGVHLHHLTYYLTGKHPVKVAADQASYGWFDSVVDDVSCLLRYENGTRCQMWFSKSALGHRNGLRVRVFGKQASAEWFQMEPESLHISTVNGARVTLDRAGDVSVANESRYQRFKAGHPSGFIEAFANLYVDMADCLTETLATGKYSSEHVFGIDHAEEGMRLFESVWKAAQTESWVQIPREERVSFF